MRLFRVTEAGLDALRGLERGDPVGTAGRALGRRLVEAGAAIPLPPNGDPPATTVLIPVRDRPSALDRCLGAIGPGVHVIVVDDGSRDERLIAATAARHGARVVRHDRPAGPAAARNTGLGLVDTPLVAFIDSDCVPDAGWLARLARHFADPLVGIAAPRIVPDDRLPISGALASVERHRSPLDMGRKPGPVAPDARVRYVPTAALVARREVIGAGFDPSLRHGEDVDLVWRVCKAGWRIRYDPTVCVRHDEPRSWRKQLERRFRYGTSAAPLSARHPAEVTHLPVWPSPSLVALFVAARRPAPAVLLTALQAANLAGRLGPEVPRTEALRLSVTSALSSLVGVASACALFALPALTAAARSRRALLLASLFLASPALLEWQRLRPPVAPPRWLAACIADDGAYGLGVLAGCARHRTLRPLMPRLRARATR